MTIETVLNSVRNYLEAERYHETACREVSNADWAASQLKRAERELREHLNAPSVATGHPVVNAAKAYVGTGSPAGKYAGSENGAPVTSRDQAKRALELALARHHVAGRSELPSHPRIVIGVDASEQSRWAVEVGGALALRLDGAVTLIHVVQPVVPYAPEIGYDDSLWALRRQQASEVLQTARAALPPTLCVESIIEEGEPAAMIAHTARDAGASFIVIGTHGRSSISTFLLGSTARAVVREASCPVITIAHAPRAVDQATVERAAGEVVAIA